MILSEPEIQIQLNGTAGWELNNNELVKKYIFADFTDAMSFVVKVAFISEKENHHPNILIHSWNKVKISVSTHSENGITNKDIDLIQKIERKD